MFKLLTDKKFFELCVDSVTGAVKDKDPEFAKNSDEKIRERFFDILGVKDAEDKYFELRFQTYQREIMALIVETISETMPDFFDTPFMNRFVDYRPFKRGEKPVFEVDDQNLFVVSKIADGHWDTRRQKALGKTDITVDFDTYDVYVYDDLLSFLVGRTDFPALIAKIRQSIMFDMHQRIFANFISIPDMVNADLKRTGSPSDKALVELCEIIGAFGGTPVIMGTRLGLLNIQSVIKDFWVTAKDKEDVRESGAVQTWQSYEIVPIPSVIKPGTFQLLPDQNKLLVLPMFSNSRNNKFIKVANSGLPNVRQVDGAQGNQDQTLEYQLQYRMGTAIVIPHYFGVADFA